MFYWLIKAVLLCLLHSQHLHSAGFDYPDQMPSPHEIIVYNNVLFGVFGIRNKLETPIAIRIAHIGTTGAWNCVAQYDANALDVNTKKRPIVDELPDDKYLSSQTRALCLQYTYIKILHAFYPKVESYYIGLFTLWGLDDITTEIDESVIGCDHDNNCLTQLATDNNFEPNFMSNIVANEIIEFFMNDGWNTDGSKNSLGECTANCKPYIDTTNYEPTQPKKNDKNTIEGKTCKGNDFWVPLLETDHQGFFFRHEHVTPHIGITAETYLIDEYKTAKDPKYDYDLESELLLDRLKVLATNDTQKMLVEFFDNKLSVRGMIGLALLRQYPDSISYEDFVNYVIGISLSEHDALLQSWNQKIEFDLIRPTTVIQRKNTEKITTYGGPYQGIKTFEAKDFEPYIRVMPHSEYPSGSACLCQSYLDFVKTFVKQEFGDDNLYDLQWYRGAGSSFVEPDMTPKNDMLLNVSNMEHLYHICSESRLWGGMHFTTSIHSAKEICSGIGVLGYEYAYELKKDSTFLGQVYPSDYVDIEQLWLPFLKALDFIARLNFGDIINGNVEFDADILKLLPLFLRGASDFEKPEIESVYDLMDQIIMYLKMRSSMTSEILAAKRNGIVIDKDVGNMNKYVANNRMDMWVIVLALGIAVSFCMIGICVGSIYNYKHVQAPLKQEYL